MLVLMVMLVHIVVVAAAADLMVLGVSIFSDCFDVHCSTRPRPSFISFALLLLPQPHPMDHHPSPAHFLQKLHPLSRHPLLVILRETKSPKAPGNRRLLTFIPFFLARISFVWRVNKY
jgi:hypothetical protein